MSDIGPAPTGNALVERVKAILLSPKTEWPKIEAEPATIGDIYKKHVIPLAAIGPVASFIGQMAFGVSILGITYRPSLMSALSTAIIGYVVTLVMVYVLALVIDALAPQFSAVKNQTAAFKVAAYGATASWVAGIFGILPALAILGILGGLYSLYLIYLGLPVLMKAPEEKAVGYVAVVILVMIVAGLLIGVVTASLSGMVGGGLGPSLADRGSVSGTMTVPGLGTIDAGKIEEAGRKMEAAAERAKSGQPGPAIAHAELQALMPGAIAGLTRTSIEGGTANAGGIGGSNAEARYGSGDNTIKLSITDMGAMGGLAALGGALNIESSKQNGTSYEKIGKVDGRMTTEKYDSATKSGTYSTIVADRVMVEADGTVPSIDVLKAAVASVGLDKVAALAK